MQYQKEEIRTAIVHAATEEFFTYGYEKASLRGICTRAGTSVGNLYRYFENRDKIFDEVVGTLYRNIMYLVREQIFDRKNGYDLKEIADALSGHILQNYGLERKRLLVLLEKSKGSRYENARSEICDMMKERIRQEYYPQEEDEEVQFLCEVMANTFLEGVIRIVRENHAPEISAKLFHDLFLIVFDDAEERLARIRPGRT